MIVRILGEGQIELDDSQLASLDELDQELLKALDGGNEAAYRAVLERLLHKIRSEGSPVPADRFVPSDLTLPDEHASLAEVRELLASGDAGDS